MHRLSTLALLLAAAAPAYAADDSDTIIVTATRGEQEIDETGQAVTVITSERIARTQGETVSDLLAETPGVTVTRNGGLGSLTAVRIRGAEDTQTLVLIDGVRVGDPSSPGGAFDFGNLILGNIERIEVVRGPNSVPWGSQALGGVVNIVTAAAAPEDGFGATLDAQYGHADTALVSGRVSASSGAFSGALRGGWYRTDGISTFAGGSERDGYRQHSLNGRLHVAIMHDISIDLRGWFADSRIELDGFRADTNQYQETQEIYGYAGINAALLDGRFKNRVAFTLADINRANFDRDVGPQRSFFAQGRSERLEYQGDFAFDDRIRAIFGAETETSRIFTGKVDEATGIDSAYAQLVVKPISALTVTGGVRHDSHDDFGSETTFGANMAFALGSSTLLRANYGEGFKAPTLYQLRSEYGNADLQPERARAYDIGIEQRLLGDRIVASLTLFQRRTRNQIDFIFPAPDPVEQPFGAYANVARTRAKGLELLLNVNPVDALSVEASYSYVDSENRTPGFDFGKPLARRARHSMNLGADYEPVAGVRVGASIRHVGDSFDNAFDYARIDSYVLTGLRASWNIDPRLTLHGRIDNLFDVRYETVADYGTIGRAAYVGIKAGF